MVAPKNSTVRPDPDGRKSGGDVGLLVCVSVVGSEVRGGAMKPAFELRAEAAGEADGGVSLSTTGTSTSASRPVAAGCDAGVGVMSAVPGWAAAGVGFFFVGGSADALGLVMPAATARDSAERSGRPRSSRLWIAEKLGGPCSKAA